MSRIPATALAAPESTALLRELRDAVRALDELGGAGAAGRGPRGVEPIQGVLDGTPVLDPLQGVEQLRGALGQHASLLRLGDGPLHVDGAHVHRDVARFLGHPVASVGMPDGTRRLLHAVAQIGRSDGYATEREAWVSAARTLHQPGEVAAGFGGDVAVMPVGGVAGAGPRRFALALLDDTMDASVTTTSFWSGSSTERVAPAAASRLRYELDHAAVEPATGIVRHDLNSAWHPLDGVEDAPPLDAGSIIPDAELDRLSVVGFGDAVSEARRTAEARLELLAPHVARPAIGPTQAARQPEPSGLARHRALDVMAASGVTEAAGWSGTRHDQMRDALATSARSAEDVQELMHTLRQPLGLAWHRPLGARGDLPTADPTPADVPDWIHEQVLPVDEVQRLLVAVAARTDSAEELLRAYAGLQHRLRGDFSIVSHFDSLRNVLVSVNSDAYQAGILEGVETMFASPRPAHELVELLDSVRRIEGVRSYPREQANATDRYLESVHAIAASGVAATRLDGLADAIAVDGIDGAVRHDLLLAALHEGWEPAAVERAVARVRDTAVDPQAPIIDAVRRIVAAESGGGP